MTKFFRERSERKNFLLRHDDEEIFLFAMHKIIYNASSMKFYATHRYA
jgi:hypothetical protein